ncbi:Radial spoke head protein 4 A [Perkinsus chesapeaki]|uniref:Radial spoke head protein 4 A n=1 Tax=Perkinsus chesapeaki TaxID=330153 RepID=A0A7J6N0E8_PERCH|nr:Radial spoke head protein 4 A [Perkinsus chesapeaki]
MVASLPSTRTKEIEAVIDKKDGAHSRTVREHLTRVIEAITILQPEDPLDAFEEVSRMVRAGGDGSTAEDQEQANVEGDHRVLKGLLAMPVDEEGNTKTEGPGLTDVVAEQHLLNSAGMGVPPTEAVMIGGGLRRLATSVEGITKARFWGKVLCDSPAIDYLIAEAEMDGGGAPLSEEEEAAGADAPGRLGGPNCYTYFVSNDGGRGWQALPHVLPAQIASARLIKKIFTGVLEAPVTTWPPFPGKERELLRAQIARISHATCLVPVDYYIRDEETSEVSVNSEYAGASPDTSKLLNVTGYWRHGCDYIINANGRTVWPEIAELEEGEEEPQEAVVQRKMMARDSEKPMVGGPIGSGEASTWTGKCHGDCAQYATYKQVDGAAVKSYVTYGTVALQSTQWPGAAVVVGNGGKHLHTYIGYGMKAGPGGRVAGGPGEIRPTPPVEAEADDPIEEPVREEVDAGEEDAAAE